MNEAYGTYLAFPFRVGEDGRTAAPASFEEHVKEEIVQLVLTGIGERRFQPDLGTNVRRLVFENLDEVTAGITKSTISQALSRWLGHRAEMDNLIVEVEGSTLSVDLRYSIAGTTDSRVLRFQRSGE
ncbi:MAG TPA: GPW/gp25 family protein [Thermoanaerobaculia bacterium]|nr:GPW/gp25 family protein [Thermoanaerobaculia bacterium]